ncbi:MAG TPA: threonine/serine exporter family protein [Methylomusa anaerophila]|uniref:Inner membrane protein YjjP n=1 Tax=Methylomusa anaerophila TaxID=1930071 RepID=A0A348AJK6_9FIRM|nr:threonine/serine exporter family protein [Methylomusa anaerophila]BBB91254.1 inner membrane protein YjjP [Methylomusa anaerophila]HML89752.1 threonine/serine exporter family protein [Methylomusa anaerophila]
MFVQLEQIVAITILAGEIMLKNGAETSRVEETMSHIARACGARQVDCFAIPTGVFLSAADAWGRTHMALRRVHNRTINLDRIAKVNELSRRLADGRIDYECAHSLLERIGRERTGFSLVPSMVASGVVGCTVAILLNAGPAEATGAFVAAFTVRYIAHIISRLHGAQFTFEFFGGMTAAIIGVWLHHIWSGISQEQIVVGGIMPLVPGMAVTNAIRDVIAGDLLSGLSRGLEAALTAVAVSMGVVIVLAVRP